MSSDTAITKADGNGAAIAREGFGTRELERRHETAATAAAAQARAEVEAMYVVALQRPRSWDDVRVKVLAEVKRKGFAQRAYFAVPRGSKPGRITGQYNPSPDGPRGLIEGLSIRYVETAIRCAGNVTCPARTTYEDDEKRKLTIAVIDLESNVSYPKDITIAKTVERKKTRDGDLVLGQRTNTSGQQVFIVACTDEELVMKENNLTSRTLRTLGLRIIPADILEESEEEIAKTVKSEVERDPAAAKKKVVDGFATLGVLPSQLEEYLRHPLDSCSPAEIQMLGGLYRAVRDGEVSWAEVMGSVAKPEDAPEASEAKQTAAKRVTEKIKARMPKEKKDEAKVAPKEEAKPAATPAPATEHSDAEPPAEPRQREPGED